MRHDVKWLPLIKRDPDTVNQDEAHQITTQTGINSTVSKDEAQALTHVTTDHNKKACQANGKQGSA